MPKITTKFLELQRWDVLGLLQDSRFLAQEELKHQNSDCSRIEHMLLSSVLDTFPLQTGTKYGKNK